jgi:hypothetical protein
MIFVNDVGWVLLLEHLDVALRNDGRELLY